MPKLCWNAVMRAPLLIQFVFINMPQQCEPFSGHDIYKEGLQRATVDTSINYMT